MSFTQESKVHRFLFGAKSMMIDNGENVAQCVLRTDSSSAKSIMKRRGAGRVFVDTGLGVWFVVLCCCRDPSDCLSPALEWSLPLLLANDFWSGMVSDGFANAENWFVDPGKREGGKSLGR